MCCGYGCESRPALLSQLTILVTLDTSFPDGCVWTSMRFVQQFVATGDSTASENNGSESFRFHKQR